MANVSNEDEIRCREACGKTMIDDRAAEHAGWSRCFIAGGWRCGACEGELWRAGAVVGTEPADLVDPLPPTSIGALKKETASTILPPSVKG